MYFEATKHRVVVTPELMDAPLTIDEVSAAVRGRHRWNIETKEWDVAYRPTRDLWIIMLQTINPRIFAMPVPKVVPT